MSCSNRGFTMVELMVAVLIMTVGLLGLFQAVYATINASMGNQLRGEAVNYGDEVMGLQINNKTFANLSTGKTIASFSHRQISSGYWNFSSLCSTSSVSSNSTSVQVLVSWKYKGARFTHTLSTLVSK